jgi:hypothetical protein
MVRTYEGSVHSPYLVSTTKKFLVSTAIDPTFGVGESVEIMWLYVWNVVLPL